MKRRRFFQAIAAAPAAPALLGQQPSPGRSSPASLSGDSTPAIDSTVADAAADSVPRFFNAQQLPALRRLSDILMPSANGAPGALDAGAPEFLDFLIGQSPADRQQLYRAGLDALNAQAKKKYKRAFAEVDAAQADVLLAPLREAWTPEAPADPLARFLREAKKDVRTATTNSREWSQMNSSGGRRFGGGGLYWYPLD